MLSFEDFLKLKYLKKDLFWLKTAEVCQFLTEVPYKTKLEARRIAFIVSFLSGTKYTVFTYMKDEHWVSPGA